MRPSANGGRERVCQPHRNGFRAPAARRAFRFARIALPAAVLAACWAGAPARAGGPENVAVAVNADSWASRLVANEFVRLRNIPPGNVVYLEGLPTFETIDVGAFRERILWPVLNTLNARRLAPQIDCLAYSTDFPTAVNARRDAEGLELPQALTPVGSLNGMTYLYPLTLSTNLNYLNLNINLYARQPMTAPGAAAWTDTEQQDFRIARQAMQERQWGEALRFLKRLSERHAANADLHFLVAGCLARSGRADDAAAALTKAVEAGWWNAARARMDPDLESLREREDFEALLVRMEQTRIPVQPALGFRSSYAWQVGGRPAADGAGMRYLLSTMLACTSGRGNTVREALDALRRSAAADGSFPDGTVYFMRNNDVRSTTRHWAFESAAARLRELGVRAEVLRGVLPQGRNDVVGAVIGAADFQWNAAGSVILPGAICEHLTSHGGNLRGGGQTPLSEWIRQGAAGSCGTVAEPLSLQQKFPLAFLHVHYAEGCTLAEAFYQSVTGPYQLLIVGDPLCRPFARLPRLRLDGVRADQEVEGMVVLRGSALPGDGPPVDRYELFVDGRRHDVSETGEFAWDTAAGGEGWRELRLVGVANGRIQTRHHAVTAVRVNRRGRRLTTSRPPERVPWDGTVRLRARLEGALRLTLYQNGRVLETREGHDEIFEISARRVGPGFVQLAVTAVPADDPEGVVHSAPVTFEVDLPEPAAPQNVPDNLVEGLRVTPDGGTPSVVRAAERDVAAEGGVAAGQGFTLEGYYRAEETDLYPLQVRYPGALRVTVNGREIELSDTRPWRFAPVALAKGLHRIEIASDGAAGQPALDLRFGRVPRRITGAEFLCTPANED